MSHEGNAAKVPGNVVSEVCKALRIDETTSRRLGRELADVSLARADLANLVSRQLGSQADWIQGFPCFKVNWNQGELLASCMNSQRVRGIEGYWITVTLIPINQGG